MITRAIKYGLPCCGPCKVTEDNLKKIGLPFESVEVDDDIMEEKNLRTVPTTDFFDENDNLVTRETGLLTLEKIKEILDNNGNGSICVERPK